LLSDEETLIMPFLYVLFINGKRQYAGGRPHAAKKRIHFFIILLSKYIGNLFLFYH